MYLTLIAILISSSLYAQLAPGQIYFPDNNTKVYDGSRQLTAAWSGGLNCPQISVVDLNNDKKTDLAIYDNSVGVKTFINTGVNGAPNYIYDGRYEANFPGIPRDYKWMHLVDYNKDDIPDLFANNDVAFNVYIGYYDGNNRLAFNHYRHLRYMGFSGSVNAEVFGSDIPAVADIDGDGYLDFLTYARGATILYYKNCTKKDGLPKDSIAICVADECWGSFAQNSNRTMQLHKRCMPFSGSTCKGCPEDGSGNKTTDGYNTLCIADFDNDGDNDVLNGNAAFTDIQFIRNGKSDLGVSVDTMIGQDTIWGSNGIPMTMRQYPAAFYADIDQDGDKDLLFTPTLNERENYRSISYYRNMGTASKSNYVYQSDTFLMTTMIDIGSYSRPVLYDFDRDGKKDMFIGSKGYYQNDESFKTAISYYENGSEIGYPTFKRTSNDFMGMSTKGLKGASLAFGDVNNDGTDDMLVGQIDGTILLFKNTAANNTVQPKWSATGELIKTTKNTTLDVGSKAAPLVYDIDTDGRPDLIVGSEMGFLFYYKNTGAPGAVAFDSVTNKLGGIRVQSPFSSSTSPVPFIGAVDDTKKQYLLLGTRDGNILRYDGFQNGNTTTPYTRVDSFYQDINVGRYTAPVTEDVDGDGKYELFIGNELGGVSLYRQLFTVGVNGLASDKSDVKVYPNPANNYVTVSWSGVFKGEEVQVSLVSVTGQKLLQMTGSPATDNLRLQVADIASGVYYCVIQSAGKKTVTPLAIVR